MKRFLLQNYQNSNITHKNTTYANITLDAWQKHIKDQINTMKTNGYDGLYIRGFNLYEYSHKDTNTYNVMMHFLDYAHKLDMKVIIQDGHIFIDDFMKNKENKTLISGVLREDVYTKYNKKNRTLGQDKIISDEKKAFLDQVVKYGMKAYVVEYTKASDWKAVIDQFTFFSYIIQVRKHQYITDSTDLSWQLSHYGYHVQ